MPMRSAPRKRTSPVGCGDSQTRPELRTRVIELPRKVVHWELGYPTDFTDSDADFTDATRGYPTDFTDEFNRLNLISFRIACVGKVRIAVEDGSRS